MEVSCVSNYTLISICILQQLTILVPLFSVSLDPSGSLAASFLHFLPYIAFLPSRFTVRLLGRIVLNFILPFYHLLIIPQSITDHVTLLFEPFPRSPFLLAPYSDIPQPGSCFPLSSLILHSRNSNVLMVPRLIILFPVSLP